MGQVGVEYLIDESQHSETETGVQIVEAYLVTGLDRGPGLLSRAKWAAGVPVMHQPHDHEPGVFVVKRDPKPYLRSQTEAKVLITFGTPTTSSVGAGLVTWRFHGTLRDRQTNFDYAGQKILVNYYATNEVFGRPPVVGQVRGTVAQGVLEMWKYSTQPPTVTTGLLNKLNRSRWNAGEKWTWLCADVDVEPFGAGYKLKYVFLYDPETHIRSAVYRDIQGFIPSDIEANLDKTVPEGRGWTNARVQGDIEFGTLGLPNNVLV